MPRFLQLATRYRICGGIVRLFAQVFDGTSKRGNLADSCAYRTGSHVRLCAHRKTRRSHQSGSPSPNQPYPHKPVPERTFCSTIDVIGSLQQSARRETACSADHRAIRHSILCRQVGDIGNLTYVKTYTMCRNQTHRRSIAPEPPSHACHDIRRPTDMITQRIQVAGYHSVLQSICRTTGRYRPPSPRTPHTTSRRATCQSHHNRVPSSQPTHPQPIAPQQPPHPPHPQHAEM